MTNVVDAIFDHRSLVLEQCQEIERVADALYVLGMDRASDKLNRISMKIDGSSLKAQEAFSQDQGKRAKESMDQVGGVLSAFAGRIKDEGLKP